MKILFIAHNCVLKSNQKRLEEISKYGVEIVLLVPPWNIESCGKVYIEKKYDPGYKIIVGKAVFSYLFNQRYLQFYPELPFVLMKEKPDIIDLWEEPWSLITFLTILFKNIFLKKTKVVVETEQNIYKNFPIPFSLFEKYAIKNTDAIISRSNSAKDVVIKKGFTKAIGVVPNGIDLEEFASFSRESCRKAGYVPRFHEEPRIEGIKIRYSLKDSFVIGFIGRIEEEKGVMTLLRAFKELKLENLKLLFVGNGKFKDFLEEESSNLGIRDKVIFTGAISFNDIIYFLHCIDILILPSKTTSKWKEQFGRVLIEAMAAGIPVIGSSSGEIPNVISDAGLVFKEDNYLDLLEKIRLLLEDKSLYESFIKKGLERVKNNYSWNKVAEKSFSIYQNLFKN